MSSGWISNPQTYSIPDNLESETYSLRTYSFLSGEGTEWDDAWHAGHPLPRCYPQQTDQSPGTPFLTEPGLGLRILLIHSTAASDVWPGE